MTEVLPPILFKQILNNKELRIRLAMHLLRPIVCFLEALINRITLYPTLKYCSEQYKHVPDG